jgi:regulator of CtrA degradation
MTEISLRGGRPERAKIVLDFAASELFDRTFQDGMELVEDAAAYLDGPGRQDSRTLHRNAALAYAGESMRLTTRLMQVASWLLVQRAVREGDMSALEACEDRYRLSREGEEASNSARAAQGPGADDPLIAALPSGLVELVRRSERLFERVGHLDRVIYLETPKAAAHNAVLSQFDRLRDAFGA